jgi:hypothetical protein
MNGSDNKIVGDYLFKLAVLIIILYFLYQLLKK